MRTMVPLLELICCVQALEAWKRPVAGGGVEDPVAFIVKLAAFVVLPPAVPYTVKYPLSVVSGMPVMVIVLPLPVMVRPFQDRLVVFMSVPEPVREVMETVALFELVTVADLGLLVVVAAIGLGETDRFGVAVGAVDMVTVKLVGLVFWVPTLPLTLTVVVPAWVGVPEIVTFIPLISKSRPFQLAGLTVVSEGVPVPPEAVIATEVADRALLPAVPVILVRDGVRLGAVGDVTLTVRVVGLLAGTPPIEPKIVNDVVPTALGVPETVSVSLLALVTVIPSFVTALVEPAVSIPVILMAPAVLAVTVKV